MQHHDSDHVAAVAPLLAPGEDVWAVFPGRPRSLVATGRRLFLVADDDVREISLAELAQVRREQERLVVIEPWRGAPIGVHVDPMDEEGLQALAVLGLLVASGNRGSEPPVAVPEPGPRVVRPAAPGRRRSRRTGRRTAGRRPSHGPPR